MTLTVGALDADDDDAWAGFYDVRLQAELFGRPYADLSDSAAVRVGFTQHQSALLTLGWLGRVDGDVVACASAVLPLRDNREVAWMTLHVHPAHRRRGFGSALLEAVESDLADRGRKVVQTEVARTTASDTLDADQASASAAGVGFAAARGYRLALASSHYVLDLPTDPRLLDRLKAHAAERIGSYRLVSWVDRAPEEWLPALCDLEAAFVEEAPMGELELEPEVWTPQRWREGEDRRLAREQRTFVTIAVTPEGRAVGSTLLFAGTRTVRGGASQGGTIVLPVHRGHRLGLGLKVANLQLLLGDGLAPTMVHTYTADVNAAMIAVNAALGFRAVEIEEEWQSELSGSPDAAAAHGVAS